MLTRGNTALWDSAAVIATGLSRTCARNGGKSSGVAGPTFPTPQRSFRGPAPLACHTEYPGGYWPHRLHSFGCLRKHLVVTIHRQ